MVQYSHVRGGLKPKRRVIISRALAKVSLYSNSERLDSKRFVAEPVDSESICFANLPYEIRRMIWYACFEPRVVTMCAHSGVSRTRRSRGRGPAISSIRATMPLTLRINRESRYETLLHYPDLIQNPTLFRDSIYFNPDLDKLDIQILHNDNYTSSLLQLYHRGRTWRRMTAQCLCCVFSTLSKLATLSQSMCKMVHFLISRQGFICSRCAFHSTLFRQCFEQMEKFHKLKTIVYQAPHFNESMVINNISEKGSWTLNYSIWKAFHFYNKLGCLDDLVTETIEDDNWRITLMENDNL